MKEDASKVLVCYATGTGCTRGVAERIGRTLERMGSHVDVVSFESSPDPTPYDAVVAGSGVRAGSWHPVAKRWMTRNGPALRATRVALFTVGIALAHGIEKTDEMVGYTDRLLERIGLEPLDIGVFAGWYDPRKFNFLERKIMKIAKSPEGDFRDWGKIEGWAASLAPKLAIAGRASVA